VGWKKEEKEKPVNKKSAKFQWINLTNTPRMRNLAVSSKRRLSMGSRSNCYCWEIMQCDESEKCSARIDPEKPCWEIIAELGDYRSACDICRDCIVHVLKTEIPVLTHREVKYIVTAKTGCKLGQNFNNGRPK
jgi:hypothetical protein